MRRTIRAVEFILGWYMSLAVGALVAQEAVGEGAADDPTKAPAIWDDTSSKLLGEWVKKEYSLAQDGVDAGSLIMDCQTQSFFGRLGSRAQYLWEHGKGELYWDDPQAGAMIERQGWSKDMLDFFFNGRTENVDFTGCTLKAEAVEDYTVIHVSGPSPIQEFHFSPEGVLTKVVVLTPEKDGIEPSLMELQLDYQRLNGYWMARQWTLEMDLPGMGKLVQTTRVGIGLEGPFHVMKEARVETLLDGTKVSQAYVRFGNWRLSRKPTENE
ncbi:MAG: hypothetical protein PHC78_01375 [Verrucomicrobiota bacterium]|nr:hypothetical protein [Verrucomicrobiota bacterium]